MPNWSVTNTFSSGTTIDHSQVNQNFTDIINASSDGTKDMSINALTLAGALTANGNVTLGNASGDDITITGSLAASVAIKTNNSFDIGSATLALASVYLGAPSSRSTRLRANQSLAASNTLIFPDGNGTNRHLLKTDGSGNLSWVAQRTSSFDLHNISITTSVAASALTITLDGADGTDLSSTNEAIVCFRNATAATGTVVERAITSNITLTISSGSTLGHTSGNNHYIYVYLLDNSGTVELAVSSRLFDEGTISSTSSEGGGGAADSNSTMYSTTARSNVPIRLIGRMKSNQTTAGTWAAVPTEISMGPFEKETISCSYNTNAGQTLEVAGGGEVIVFEDKVFDTHAAYNTSTGVFTCPKSGTYFVSTTILLASAAWVSGEVMDISIRKNSTNIHVNEKIVEANVTYGPSRHLCGIVRADAGDTIDIFFDHNRSGGNVTLYTGATYNTVSIAWLGP